MPATAPAGGRDAKLKRVGFGKMDSNRFDALSRVLASSSRRGLLGLAGAAVAFVSGMRHAAQAAQSEGTLALGAECSSSEQCHPESCPAITPVMCADNGFASDGPLNCCSEELKPCYSDADCCEDLRCAWGEICNQCRRAPIWTRFVGQLCSTDADCIPLLSGSAKSRCVSSICTCVGTSAACAMHQPAADIPLVPEDEAAMMIAIELSREEVMGQFDTLYDRMHPDAKTIIPREAVVGWYESTFVPGAAVARPIKVRIVPWTWGVNDKTYAGTADVLFEQQLTDGSVIRDEVRLVKDYNGNWTWFFGRDPSFVEDQINRFSS